MGIHFRVTDVARLLLISRFVYPNTGKRCYLQVKNCWNFLRTIKNRVLFCLGRFGFVFVLSWKNNWGSLGLWSWSYLFCAGFWRICFAFCYLETTLKWRNDHSKLDQDDQRREQFYFGRKLRVNFVLKHKGTKLFHSLQLRFIAKRLFEAKGCWLINQIAWWQSSQSLLIILQMSRDLIST